MPTNPYPAFRNVLLGLAGLALVWTWTCNLVFLLTEVPDRYPGRSGWAQLRLGFRDFFAEDVTATPWSSAAWSVVGCGWRAAMLVQAVVFLRHRRPFPFGRVRRALARVFCAASMKPRATTIPQAPQGPVDRPRALSSGDLSAWPQDNSGNHGQQPQALDISPLLLHTEAQSPPPPLPELGAAAAEPPEPAPSSWAGRCAHLLAWCMLWAFWTLLGLGVGVSVAVPLFALAHGGFREACEPAAPAPPVSGIPAERKSRRSGSVLVSLALLALLVFNLREFVPQLRRWLHSEWSSPNRRDGGGGNVTAVSEAFPFILEEQTMFDLYDSGPDQVTEAHWASFVVMYPFAPEPEPGLPEAREARAAARRATGGGFPFSSAVTQSVFADAVLLCASLGLLLGFPWRARHFHRRLHAARRRELREREAALRMHLRALNQNQNQDTTEKKGEAPAGKKRGSVIMLGPIARELRAEEEAKLGSQNVSGELSGEEELIGAREEWETQAEVDARSRAGSSADLRGLESSSHPGASGAEGTGLESVGEEEASSRTKLSNPPSSKHSSKYPITTPGNHGQNSQKHGGRLPRNRSLSGFSTSSGSGGDEDSDSLDEDDFAALPLALPLPARNAKNDQGAEQRKPKKGNKKKKDKKSKKSKKKKEQEQQQPRRSSILALLGFGGSSDQQHEQAEQQRRLREKERHRRKKEKEREKQKKVDRKKEEPKLPLPRMLQPQPRERLDFADPQTERRLAAERALKGLDPLDDEDDEDDEGDEGDEGDEEEEAKAETVPPVPRLRIRAASSSSSGDSSSGDSDESDLDEDSDSDDDEEEEGNGSGEVRKQRRSPEERRAAARARRESLELERELLERALEREPELLLHRAALWKVVLGALGAVALLGFCVFFSGTAAFLFGCFVLEWQHLGVSPEIEDDAEEGRLRLKRWRLPSILDGPRPIP